MGMPNPPRNDQWFWLGVVRLAITGITRRNVGGEFWVDMVNIYLLIDKRQWIIKLIRQVILWLVAFFWRRCSDRRSKSS